MRDFSHRFESACNLPNWVPTPRNRRAKQNVRKLDAVVNRIIRSRREAGGDRGDLLSKLIHARDEVDQTGMTDRQLRDEVMTLFLAGHETTANALAWTWFLLGQNPEVENRLLGRIEHRSSAIAMPDVADVPKLTYTEAVLKESMRLLSAGLRLQPPRAGRRHDRWLSYSRRQCRDHEPMGHAPRSTLVVDEPEQVPPGAVAERRHQSNVPTYAYFPFGGGPRVCIGNTFAMLEAILVVASHRAAASASSWSSRKRSNPGRRSRCAPRRNSRSRSLPQRRRPLRPRPQLRNSALSDLRVAAIIAVHYQQYEQIGPARIKDVSSESIQDPAPTDTPARSRARHSSDAPRKTAVPDTPATSDAVKVASQELATALIAAATDNVAIRRRLASGDRAPMRSNRSIGNALPT